jgi:hypothetical protein
MKMQTIWLVGMLALCVILLAVAILVQGHTEAAGKVLAILAIVVGSLVTVGTALFKKNGGGPNA